MKRLAVCIIISGFFFSCNLKEINLVPYITSLFAQWPKEPFGLTYTHSVANYNVGQKIDDNLPSYNGTVKSFSVDPDLPSGLSIDSTIGVISGTPTDASVAANYVVTASNDDGSTTTTISITVNSPSSEESSNNESNENQPTEISIPMSLSNWTYVNHNTNEVGQTGSGIFEETAEGLKVFGSAYRKGGIIHTILRKV